MDTVVFYTAVQESSSQKSALYKKNNNNCNNCRNALTHLKSESDGGVAYMHSMCAYFDISLHTSHCQLSSLPTAIRMNFHMHLKIWILSPLSSCSCMLKSFTFCHLWRWIGCSLWALPPSPSLDALHWQF